MKKILAILVAFLFVAAISSYAIADDYDDDVEKESYTASTYFSLPLKADKECIKACGQKPQGNDAAENYAYQLCVANCHPIFDQVSGYFDVDSFFDVFTTIDNDTSDDFRCEYMTSCYPDLDLNATDDFQCADMTSCYPNLDTDSTDDFQCGYVMSCYPNLDTDYTNDFSGSWNDLTDMPAGFADGVDDAFAYDDTELRGRVSALESTDPLDYDECTDLDTCGFLTSYTETDPVFSASASSGITPADISNWNSAFAWGDHAAAGYLTSYTESDPQVDHTTADKWCVGTGTAVSCTEDSPVTECTCDITRAEFDALQAAYTDLLARVQILEQSLPECTSGDTRPCYTGPPATQNVGECSDGTETCVGGKWNGVCAGEVLPATEICDLLDNDCDSVVDNDCVTFCEDLDSDGFYGPTISCPAGDDCDDLITTVHPGGLEICNGLDDNCDGFVDEGQGGEPCNTGQPGICADGITACVGGNLACMGINNPASEICDGLDNDCDWAVDESDPQEGTWCDTGQVGICADGQFSCVSGSLQCLQTNQPTSEICNGLDDNCDGTVDEGADATCNDGIGCTADSCVSGSCLYTPDNNVCDDGNECTADSCTPMSGCISQLLTGNPCDDGDPNTIDDTCVDGVCVGTQLCTDNYPDTWIGTLIGSYPGSGTVYETIFPLGDEDWMRVYAYEPSFVDVLCRAQLTYVPPGKLYEVCVCWSSATTGCGYSPQMCTNAVASWISTTLQAGYSEGYCDIVVRPVSSSIDYSCEDYILEWHLPAGI